MFKRMPETPGLNLADGRIRVEFIALTKAAILRSDLTAFETVGYFFRKGKSNPKISVVCTIYFSRDYIFKVNDLNKIAADLYEKEVEKLLEFMEKENGKIKKYLRQIASSMKIFLENEKLLNNNSDGGGVK